MYKAYKANILTIKSPKAKHTYSGKKKRILLK
jgi:hypothetical protein